MTIGWLLDVMGLPVTRTSLSIVEYDGSVLAQRDARTTVDADSDADG